MVIALIISRFPAGSTGEGQQMPNFYAVVITTETGPVVSRFFTTIRAARRYAKWCSEKWPTQIYRGGQGGELVA